MLLQWFKGIRGLMKISVVSEIFLSTELIQEGVIETNETNEPLLWIGKYFNILWQFSKWKESADSWPILLLFWVLELRFWKYNQSYAEWWKGLVLLSK